MNNIETNLSAFLSDSVSNDSNSESIVIFSSSENAGHPVIVHLGISYSGNKYPLSYASYTSVDIGTYSIIQHPFSFQITQLDSNGSPITTIYYLNQNGILNIQDVIITELSLKGTCPEPNKLRIQYEWKSQDLESGNPEPGDPSNPDNPNPSNPDNPNNPDDPRIIFDPGIISKETARELGAPSYLNEDTYQLYIDVAGRLIEMEYIETINDEQIAAPINHSLMGGGYFIAIFNQDIESDEWTDYWTWTFISISPKDMAIRIGAPTRRDYVTKKVQIVVDEENPYGRYVYGELTKNNNDEYIFTPTDDLGGYFLAVFNQNVESYDITDYWTWTFIPTQ